MVDTRIYQQVTQHTVTPCPPEHRDAYHWLVEVSRLPGRTADEWVVRWFGYLYTAYGAWISESTIPTADVVPGSDYVFTEDTALTLARAAAPNLVVNGRTFAEWEAHWAARKAQTR